MFQGDTFEIFLMFSHSVPFLGHFGKTPGTSQGHSKCSQFSGFLDMSLRCSWDFPKMSQKQHTVGKHQENFKCVTLEHFQHIVLVHFEFSRSGTSQSRPWEHCKVHCEWATWEHRRYFLWENSRFTHRLPNWDTVVTWSGKLWMYWAVLSEWATWEHCGYFLWENFRFSHGLPNQDIAITWSGTLWMYWAFPALGTLQWNWLGKF